MPEDMYCSEQICIPPSYPYLLRQYAKAAIRTQPSDLLKWSTAYFRCLSLNLPPPVKPRLEYPIPRDFYGITPGWLKTLLYQLQNNLTIPFKILWDRWIGACLQHHTLIQLLCLGGFEDPYAIPWLKFMAICAATLTDDLTQTMILICEILTEEPEGGSAMITVETFNDLYTFLAKMDAANGQTLRNYFFRDSLLSLWTEKVQKEEARVAEVEEIVVEPEETLPSKSTSEILIQERTDDVDKVVSCPSLPEDDHYSIEYLLKDEADVVGEEEEEVEVMDEGENPTEEGEDEIEHREDEMEQEDTEYAKDSHAGDLETGEDKSLEDYDQEEKRSAKESVDHDVKSGDLEPKEETEHKPDEEEEEEGEKATEIDQVATEDQTEKVKQAPEEDETALQGYESAETIQDQPVRDLNLVFEDDATLQEDLARLRALQQELAGETDEELEKFKCRLIAEMPLSGSQEEGIKHFRHGKLEEIYSEDEKLRIESSDEMKSGELSSETQESSEEVKDARPYDDIYVEGIVGIGATVSDEIINAVVDYMKNCAKNQHGMVMPRNIRHYTCPPLHTMDY